MHSRTEGKLLDSVQAAEELNSLGQSAVPFYTEPTQRGAMLKRKEIALGRAQSGMPAKGYFDRLRL